MPTLEELEAARDPSVAGYFQRGDNPPVFLPSAPAPQQVDPTTAPRMSRPEEFDLGPTVPTYADLYGDNPAQGYARLRELRVPNKWYLNQVPIRPGSPDWEVYQNRKRAEMELWKAGRSAKAAELQERRITEAERAARAREAAAAERQKALDLKESRKQAEAEKADKLRLEGSLQQADNAIAAAKKAFGDVGLLTSGLIGGMTKWIPGTPALDLDQALEPVRAITSFEQLNRMKEASRTGGALGQIAVRELELLGASVASLNTSQGPDQLRKNLRKVVQHFTAWKEKAKKAWEVEGFPSGGGDGGAFSDPEKERRYQEWKARQGGGK